MPLSLGDRNESARRWRVVMNARFGPLYTRLRGALPADTDEFGPRAKAWQEEYEIRTRQPVDGVVSDDDLRALGIPLPPAKPVLLTVQGTAQPDPWGIGLPADTAREVLSQYDWWPVGDFPASAFPMWPSVLAGVNALVAQINRVPDRELNFAGYSQGAVIVGQVLKHLIMAEPNGEMLPGTSHPIGSLHHRLGDVRKVVFWGNPMRQQGIVAFDEWIHPVAAPDTHGILDDRLEGLENAPFEVRDYGHDNDMYSAVRDDDMSEYQVAIGKIVMRATDLYEGPNSIASQLLELATSPIMEGISMFRAMIDAAQFFTGTAHGYNIGPAIAFLRDRA